MGGVIQTVAAILLAIGAVGFSGFKVVKALQNDRIGVAVAWALLTPVLVVLAWALAFVALMILLFIFALGVVWFVLYAILS